MSKAIAGDVYWVIASSTAEEGREGMYSLLRNRIQKNGLVTDSTVFDIPLNFKVTSFDELIRLADDLTKHDSSCEQIVRRLERQVLEIDPTAELKIYFQRSSLPMEQFLHRFKWDEAKYPSHRYMKDNIELLMNSVVRMDEDVRIKSAAYNEVKQFYQSLNKKDVGTYIQKDLTSVLTPQFVQKNDFIESEHLTTLVVVVPSGTSSIWLNSYETLDSFVVPQSSRKFDVPPDKENNSLWSVTLLKSSVESFKTAARAKRFNVREFHYNADALKEKNAEQARLESEKNKQETFITRICLTSFSDACIAWLHLKAMRVFVEAVLRFGVPPKFAAFLLKPRHNKEKKLRKELEDIFVSKGMFSHVFENTHHSSSTNQSTSATLTNEFDNEENFYPYVFTSFVPFALFTQK